MIHRIFFLFSVATAFLVLQAAAATKEVGGEPGTNKSILERDEYDGRDGAAEAARDLKNSSARYCIYGRAAGLVYLAAWSDLSAKRFGVSVQAISGCFISDSLVRYAKSYNQVVLDHVSARYGFGAWETCEADARAAYGKDKR